MPKPSVALVAAGPTSRSWVARLPRLRERLGPVSASSYRVASRIVNSLRAGRPVRSHEGLTGELVLIVVPDARLATTLVDLTASSVDWRGKALVLCDSHHDSSALTVFAKRGAATASLNQIEGFDESRFVVEGDRAALRAVRGLIQDTRTRILDLRLSRKALYSAGVLFATSLCVPAVDAALECLQGAGLDAREARAIVNRLAEKTLRAYLKAGRKSWGGLSVSGGLAALREQLESVSARDARLGRQFLAALRACERVAQNPQWSAVVASLEAGGAASALRSAASAAGEGSSQRA